MEYTRVIPRDLFNEAKLLKCVGQLALLIHDGMQPVPMSLEHDGSSFHIGHTEDLGLTIVNMRWIICGFNVGFQTAYNSRDYMHDQWSYTFSYPIYVYYNDDIVEVLTYKGAWSRDFKKFCKRLKKRSK